MVTKKELFDFLIRAVQVLPLTWTAGAHSATVRVRVRVHDGVHALPRVVADPSAASAVVASYPVTYAVVVVVAAEGLLTAPAEAGVQQVQVQKHPTVRTHPSHHQVYQKVADHLPRRAKAVREVAVGAVAVAHAPRGQDDDDDDEVDVAR